MSTRRSNRQQTEKMSLLSVQTPTRRLTTRRVTVATSLCERLKKDPVKPFVSLKLSCRGIEMVKNKMKAQSVRMRVRPSLD